MHFLMVDTRLVATTVPTSVALPGFVYDLTKACKQSSTY